MSAPEIAEAEVVEPGQELAPVSPSTATTLWHTDDPATVLQKATATAEVLAPILREKGMVAEIDGKDYVQVEGWQTLGSMLGVTPVGVWTRKLDPGTGEANTGWEAKVDARTLDGRTIGSAEAMCLKAEANWADSDEYAIRSMAQTRAASKALASVLRFVVTLAGFQGSPAEEMDGVRGNGDAKWKRMKGAASSGQIGWVLGKDGKPGLLKRAGLDDESRKIIHDWAFKDEALQKGPASHIIDLLQDDPKQGALELLGEIAPPDGDLPVDETDLPDPATDSGESLTAEDLGQ